MERINENKLKMAYVGNTLLRLGFKIAGISESYTVTDTIQSETRLRELLSRQDIGIIIITSSVRKMVHDRKLSESIGTSILPLIVEVPEPGESVTEEDTLRTMIRRALGIDIMQSGNI